MRDEKVELVTASIAAATRKEGLDVKTIASGVGGWQYLDVVSKGAGKLEARSTRSFIFSFTFFFYLSACRPLFDRDAPSPFD